MRLGIKDHPNLKVMRDLKALDPSKFDVVVLDSKDSLDIDEI